MGDLRVLAHLAMAPLRRGASSHRARLDAFYAGQAQDYDHFRARLLQGRAELVADLATHLPARGGVWLELGGGTGSNLELLGAALDRLDRVVLVDLCEPLLATARDRVARRGWRNVELVHADATTFDALIGQANVVALSYALTMIPDWFAAVEVAHRALAPGGHVGVVDFHVTRAREAVSRRALPWHTRAFWRTWFALDDVVLSGDHVPYLQRRFEPVALSEHRARLPYMPFVRAPYYRFIGRRAT